MGERREDVRNLKDLLGIREIAAVEVVEWHREEDGGGPPLQVHVLLRMRDGETQRLRLKSRRACDELIEALTHHRDRVFPLN